MYLLDDTIAAIASASGGASRGIVRISGPQVLSCLDAVFPVCDQGKLQPPKHAQAFSGLLQISGFTAAAPCDVYLWPKGRSYTGQMAAELHTLGSPPLLEALLNSLCTAGARMAEPGEFTLRAFLSGRIDLTQAEAVLAVIDAAGPHELQVAMAQLAGGLAVPLHRLRDRLMELLAHLEAGFDFADEDLPFITSEQLHDQLAEAVEEIARLAAQMRSRLETQTAVRAVLIGQPNTGKSSLFNALANRSHALVSNLPGTTRDYLVAELDFDGRKCQLIDTAGIRPDSAQSADAFAWPETAAQQAAWQQIGRAHVRLLCLDATRALDAWEQAELARRDVSNQIVVWTKMDCIATVPASHPLDIPKGTVPCTEADCSSLQILTSSVTGEGLDRLRAELRRMVFAAESTPGEVMAGTAARCHQALHQALESLNLAQALVKSRNSEEFIAVEIRAALEELGRVVGAVYADDVLERIFSRFCVGK
jgi:tRNA modification GTPase